MDSAANFNNFVILDDEMLNNHICTKVIKDVFPDANIKSFTEPEKGFQHIAHLYSQPGYEESTILLLDIIMPVMNAWVFLEEFEKLNNRAKENVKIYILSSSVSKADMTRANANKYVEYYLIKPLTRESVHLMVHILNRKSAQK